MRTKACLALLAVLLVPLARAAPPKHPAFERLRSLEGRWTGKAEWVLGGKKSNAEFALAYKTTAAGNTVVETMMPGTPGEMVTVYYVDGADLAAVHYCTSGNQPQLKLASERDAPRLSFRCVGGTNMKESDSHMHSAELLLVDSDHLSGTWSAVQDGAVRWVATADLVRVK
jgi:hypothetical protein